VTSPATGELLGLVECFSPARVAEAAAAAREAQPGWEALGFGGRSRILRSLRRRLVDDSERVVATIVAETGKPHDAALFGEVAYAARALAFWTRRAEGFLGETQSRGFARRARGGCARYVPRGLVGVIGPWNYPLTTSFGDAIPALMAGNAVLLKPSELTPFTSGLMADLLLACGAPEGLLQVVTGDAATGAAVVDHADFVQFTGSTAAGRAVMRRAADTLTPVSLELGGKDPMIVLGDADLERAARCAVLYGFGSSGQACIAVERVYVERAVHDAFVNRVVTIARELRVGEPVGPGSVEVGPLVTSAQVARIDAQVRDALDRGARVLTGGGRVGDRGTLYEPTVLADVDESMLVMREESFGPVLPIRVVRDADEAVTLANASPYGLAASVFSGDARRGLQIACRLEVGACCVNDAQTNFFALELPMGGTKESGFGSRHGPAGIRKYCREQAFVVRRRPPARPLHRFPYSARRTRLVRALLRLAARRG